MRFVTDTPLAIHSMEIGCQTLFKPAALLPLIDAAVERFPDEVAATPEQLLMHIGDNNQRAVAMCRLYQLGLLENTGRRELAEAIVWILDGAHHVMSLLYDAFSEVIDAHAVLVEELTPADYDALPEVLTLYRGYDAAVGRQVGLSWTLDQGVAGQFAAGVQGAQHTRPTVATARLPKAAAGGFLFGRESEVLVTRSGSQCLELVDEMVPSIGGAA